jgi:predicted nucleic acid-binding protein
MNVLLDTNMLARLVEPACTHHPIALGAIANLKLQGDTLCIVPQSFYELWVVSTRPTSSNGRGLTPLQVAAEFAQLKTRFLVFADTPAIFDEWERLVTTLGVLGKPAHDTRLVAAMLAHNVSHLLTFNIKDFTRYSGITVLDPHTVAATHPPPSATP